MKKKASRKLGKKKFAARRSSLPLLGSIAAALLCGAAQPVYAGSATWNGFSFGDWNSAFDWTPPTVPNGPADVATFSTASIASVSFSASTQVNTIVFASDASAYFINLRDPFQLTISGAGVTNSSGVTQNFVISSFGSSPAIISFTNFASAGSNVVYNNVGSSSGGGAGADVDFFNNSTAGSAVFVNGGASVANGFGGSTHFNENSSAGNGSFTNDGGTVSGANGGSTEFRGNSTAGNGVIVNIGGSVGGAGGGSTLFFAGTTAGNATITTQAGRVNGAFGGFTQFTSASAGSATFITNGANVAGADGGFIQFSSGSTGATAKFTTNAGTANGASAGSIQFSSSAAGNATFITNGANVAGANGGFVQFSNVSNGGGAQLTTNGGGAAGADGGFVRFDTGSTAGGATFVNNPGTAGGAQTFDLTTGVFTSTGATGGAVAFYDTSTAGTARFTNNAATVRGANPGTVLFNDTSSAGTGNFTNNGGTVGVAGGAVTLFMNSSTAGNGTFVNHPGSGSSGNSGGTVFHDTSNAGSGIFVNDGGAGSNGIGGGTNFYDNSSAGNATITSNGGTGNGAATASLGSGGTVGGLNLFAGSSTAASATLIANGGPFIGSGGVIAFIGNSTGGTSTVKVFGNGFLDISPHNAPGVTIGSLEGDGNVFLGANNLTVGSNNASTTFDGVIQDGGFVAGTGGSLTKTGTGLLTLNGANTYTGSTIVDSGALLLNGSIASAKTIINSSGALLGKGTVGGDLTNNGIVVPGFIDNASLLSQLNSKAASITGVPVTTAQNLVLTVKGNYTQGAGGTLVIAYAGPAANQHSSLNVQGQANLNGTLRLVQVNDGRLGVNEQTPIITAAGGVTGEFSTVSNAPLINAKVVYESNSVLLETSQNSIADVLGGLSGISANDLAVARALDSAAGDPRAAHLFSILNAATLDQLARDIQLINPEQLSATTGVGSSVSSVHALNLQLRMEALRAGVSGFSAMGFHTADNPSDFSSGLAGPSGPDGKSGKEVAPPPPDNRWGSFITGSGEFNHVGDTSNARGFTLDSGGITLGADYRFTDHFVAGIFMGYTYTGIDLSGGGRITADAGKVGLYSTYFNGGFYVDTAVQGGYSAYDNRRLGLNGTARSSPHGGDFNLLFAPGYNWTFGALTIGPTASFQYSYQSTNGFTETGSDAPLSVLSEHSESLVSSFGIKASYDWKIGTVVVRPELRVGWEHEYGDVTTPITARLASGAGDPFNVDGPEIGRDSMHVGAGVSMVWSDRFSTYLYYDGEFFRTNYDSSTVTGGFRILF